MRIRLRLGSGSRRPAAAKLPTTRRTLSSEAVIAALTEGVPVWRIAAVFGVTESEVRLVIASALSCGAQADARIFGGST